MQSTCWILQFACLIAPVSQQEVIENPATTKEEVPAVLHVSRDVPRLVPIGSEAEASPIRPVDAVQKPTLGPAPLTTSTVEVEIPNNVRSVASGSAPRPTSEPAKPDYDRSTGVLQPEKTPVPDNLRYGNPPPRQQPQKELAQSEGGLTFQAPGQSTRTPQANSSEARPTPERTNRIQATVSEDPQTTPRVASNQQPRFRQPLPPATRQQAAPAPPKLMFDQSPIGSGVRRIPPRVSRRPEPPRTTISRNPNPSAPRTRPNTTPSRNRTTVSAPATPTAPSLKLFLAGQNGFATGQEADFQVIIVNEEKRVIEDLDIRLSPATGFRVTVLDRAASLDTRDQTVIWKIDQIQPGEQIVIRFKAIASEAGTMVHQLSSVDRRGKSTTSTFSTIAVSARQRR